jgi:hypothetical protein
MQGSAKIIQRGFTFTVAALAVSLALCGTAGANPLLSGYGGPGEGSQVILGASLIGGPPSGGHSEGSGSSGPGGVTPIVPSGSSTTGTGNGSGANRSAKHAQSGGRLKGSHTTKAAPAGAPGQALASGYAAAAYRNSVSGPALGVSDEDVLIILVALAGIAMTGLVTRRLVRVRDARKGVVTKGVSGTARPTS